MLIDMMLQSATPITSSPLPLQDAYRPCAKHLLVFMPKGSSLPKNDIFLKLACMLAYSFAAWIGRSADWLASCMQGRYCDLASVSLSD